MSNKYVVILEVAKSRARKFDSVHEAVEAIQQNCWGLFPAGSEMETIVIGNKVILCSPEHPAFTREFELFNVSV